MCVYRWCLFLSNVFFQSYSLFRQDILIGFYTHTPLHQENNRRCNHSDFLCLFNRFLLKSAQLFVILSTYSRLSRANLYSYEVLKGSFCLGELTFESSSLTLPFMSMLSTWCFQVKFLDTIPKCLRASAYSSWRSQLDGRICVLFQRYT